MALHEIRASSIGEDPAGQEALRETECVLGIPKLEYIHAPTSLLFGLMPHPERSPGSMQPDRRHKPAAHAASAIIFEYYIKIAGSL